MLTRVQLGDIQLFRHTSQSFPILFQTCKNSKDIQFFHRIMLFSQTLRVKTQQWYQISALYQQIL